VRALGGARARTRTNTAAAGDAAREKAARGGAARDAAGGAERPEPEAMSMVRCTSFPAGSDPLVTEVPTNGSHSGTSRPGSRQDARAACGVNGPALRLDGGHRRGLRARMRHSSRSGRTLSAAARRRQLPQQPHAAGPQVDTAQQARRTSRDTQGLPVPRISGWERLRNSTWTPERHCATWRWQLGRQRRRPRARQVRGVRTGLRRPGAYLPIAWPGARASRIQPTAGRHRRPQWAMAGPSRRADVA